MNGRKLVAIDPGLSGGIVTRDATGFVVSYKMPDTPQGILDVLREIQGTRPGIDGGENYCPCIVLMENVGKHRMGNSASSSVTFSRHVGHLEMALLAICMSHETIMPTVWMNDVAPGRPKGPDATTVRLRKRYIKDLMQKKYPDQKITDKTADAFGILTYLIRYTDKY